MFLDSSLTQLELSQLVRRISRDELAFKHTLTQETVYHSLLRAHRREIHREVARALEQVGSDHLDEFAAMLAQHFGEAGDDAKTFEYALRAGDAAARVYAHAEALMFYDRALEIASHPERSVAESKEATRLKDLYLKRGRTLELSGRFEDALANYHEMETRAHRDNDRALELDALMASATIYAIPTAKYDPNLGHQVLDRAFALAQELNNRAAEAKILWTRTIANYFQSRFAESVACGEQSLEIARELNLREQIAYTLNDLSRSYIGAGRANDGRAAITQARALWRELGNLPMLADNLSTSAENSFFLGEFDEALAFAREANQISTSIGNLWNEAYSNWSLGYIAIERGDLAEGFAALQIAGRIGDQSGFVIASLLAQEMSAWGYSHFGNPQKAYAITQSLTTIKDIGVTFQAWRLALIGRLECMKGNLDRAEEILKQARVGLDPDDITWFAPIFVGLAEGEVALARRDPARAIALADQMFNRMRELQLRPFIADVLLLKGRACVLQNELESASQVLQAAREYAQTLNARRVLWDILAELANVANARGDHATAQTFRAEARTIIEYIAEHAPPDLRESFLGLDRVQMIFRNQVENQ